MRADRSEVMIACGPESPLVSSPRHAGMSPVVLAYAVGPIAVALLLVMRHYGLVAKISGVTYVGALAAVQISSQLVERLKGADPGSWRLHLRVAVHVAGVTGFIYASGWGPVFGMAYAFTAFTDMQKCGARAWRPALTWSLVGCGVGQLCVWRGWMPTMLTMSASQTVGLLGSFVFGIAIRMAGAVGVQKEEVEALLALSEAHHRAVIENAAEGILSVGLDGRVLSFNAAAEAMFGWEASAILGQQVSVTVPEELHVHLSFFLASFRDVVESVGAKRDAEVIGLRRDNSEFPMMVSASLVIADGAEPVLSCMVRDMSDQKRVEARLAHQALHDDLTGLPNRAMLSDRLEQALARTRRHNRMCGVLFIDLDRFKVVNDTLGHGAGDRLLIEAARRIQQTVRESDTVSRLGGDEFVVLCEEVDGVHHATDLADRIIDTLRKPFLIGVDEVLVGASLGIALSADGSSDTETLLGNADIAMYRAKEKGRNCFELFDEEMQLWITNQNAMESALRQAVANDEMRLHYQPIVETETGVVCGFEALVRWERPGFGLVGPDAFIPMAEETGLIVDIGAWVLEEACRSASAWERKWPERRIGISVNMSARQLQTPDIVDQVSATLLRTGLHPSRLTIELTESSLVDDALSAREHLGGLRELGCNLSLDDFGTGYSSLTYLRAFPINVLKIDRSFVSTIGAERDDTAIVAAVLALARNLDLFVVAEGIETHAQLAVLIQLQCPFAQGYLFSRPCPIEEVPRLVEASFLGRSENSDGADLLDAA